MSYQLDPRNKHPGYSAYYGFGTDPHNLTDDEVLLAYSYGIQYEPQSWADKDDCRGALKKEIELRRDKPEFKAAYTILRLEGLL